LDFILAYAQADVECGIYMNIPKDFTIEEKSRGTHVLKHLKKLYGQKQPGRVWKQHLHTLLIGMGCVQSTAGECVYCTRTRQFSLYM
jgi:hypothetical protein